MNQSMQATEVMQLTQLTQVNDSEATQSINESSDRSFPTLDLDTSLSGDEYQSVASDNNEPYRYGDDSESEINELQVRHPNLNVKAIMNVAPEDVQYIITDDESDGDQLSMTDKIKAIATPTNTPVKSFNEDHWMGADDYETYMWEYAYKQMQIEWSNYCTVKKMIDREGPLQKRRDLELNYIRSTVNYEARYDVVVKLYNRLKQRNAEYYPTEQEQFHAAFDSAEEDSDLDNPDEDDDLTNDYDDVPSKVIPIKLNTKLKLFNNKRTLDQVIGFKAPPFKKRKTETMISCAATDSLKSLRIKCLMGFTNLLFFQCRIIIEMAGEVEYFNQLLIDHVFAPRLLSYNLKVSAMQRWNMDYWNQNHRHERFPYFRKLTYVLDGCKAIAEGIEIKLNTHQRLLVDEKRNLKRRYQIMIASNVLKLNPYL